MHPYITSLAKQFETHANAANAIAMKAYMRNQFEFFGIVTPLRRSITKEHIKNTPLPTYDELENILKELWQFPQREFHYFAVELLAVYKKEWDKNLIKLIEYLLTHRSWWDSVDHIATELTSPYFKKFPEQIVPVTTKWNRSKNFWLQRSSIMFQKQYKKETDKELLAKHILNVADSQEFFVQKAIGWALREYSKVNPKWVKQFVKQHDLPPLSKREALKRII